MEKLHFARFQARSLEQMSVGGEFFRFADGELKQIDFALAEPISVADSWLVSSGQVRALGRHFNRFARSIDDDITQCQLPEFFESIRSATPLVGDWFPRIEYRSDQPVGERLFFRLRQAPDRTETCTLWTLDEPDPRANPRIKGPDLSLCQKLRRMANLHGADEAVLLDADGYISDGALSAIVWWEGEMLVAPDDSTPWLPSITRELIFELATQAGFETSAKKARPEDLNGCEVWSLSALQGIRGVSSWQGVEVEPLSKLKSFRLRLNLLSEPML